MKKSTMYAVIIATLVLLVGVGALALMRDSDDNAASTATVPADSSPQATNDTNTVAPSETLPADDSSSTAITYTNSGFSPSSITVKSGSIITLNNKSSKSVELSSADHPTHTENPELNMNVVKPGDSGTITVTKTGTWGYHDHIDAGKMGTIVVQ